MKHDNPSNVVENCLQIICYDINTTVVIPLLVNSTQDCTSLSSGIVVLHAICGLPAYSYVCKTWRHRICVTSQPILYGFGLQVGQEWNQNKIECYYSVKHTYFGGAFLHRVADHWSWPWIVRKTVIFWLIIIIKTVLKLKEKNIDSDHHLIMII